jgi:hypothetical protein
MDLTPLPLLERISIERNEAGWRVRFAGPRQDRYRAGIQVIFLATVPKERMLDRATPWVLKRAQWGELHQKLRMGVRGGQAAPGLRLTGEDSKPDLVWYEDREYPGG